MTMNPREKGIGAKKKEVDDPNFNKFPKITPPSSSRQWSNHKNPRIVRVSRAFGGKDRHSKVCTVRGLRDRRIRLSVSTAIQLYDLQDRLGLSQPSKVVDWLLDSTKDEIDKLPPLPMLPQNFTQLHPPTLAYSSYEIESNDVPQSSLSHHPYSTNKEGVKIVEQENIQEGFGGFVAQNLFPILSNLHHQSSFPNMPYNNNPYFHFDPPSLSLSQFGGGFPNFSNQTDQSQQNNLPPTMNFPSSASQLYFCPSAATIPSLIPTFPASYITPSLENDQWRQINHLEQNNPLWPTTTLQLISSPMKSFTNSKYVHDTHKDDRNSSRQ